MSCAAPGSARPRYVRGRWTPGFGEAAGFSKEEAESALVMWVPAEKVAQAGIDGLAAGKAVIVPGRVNRIASAFFRVAPPALLLPVLSRNHPAMKRT